MIYRCSEVNTGPHRAAKESTISKKVFVGNLDFRTTQNDLVGLMQQAGQVVDVHLPVDNISGKPRGFAFIEFSNEEEAAAAIERFNEHELDGRALRVNEATERARPSRPGGGRQFRDGGGGGRDRPDYRSGKKRKGGSRRRLRARKRSF